jgi:transposase-like protein
MPRLVRTIQTYPDEFKAQVLAEYVAGASIFSLAKKFDLNRGTIEEWINRAGVRRGGTLSPGAREELGQLLFNHLRESMLTLTAVVVHMRDPTWLQAQTAGDLAIMLTVVHDKTAHLLGSLEQSSGADDAEGAQSDEEDEEVDDAR